MAEIIYGDSNVFNALAYGRPNPSTYDFIQQSAQRFGQAISQHAENFFQNTKGVYERMNFEEATRLARAVARKVSNVWQTDDIQPLNNIGALQHASPAMQRWLMAEPMTRQLYHNQGCDGYSSTYVDMHPGRVGEQHYDYRRAMDGFVVTDEKHGWYATNYIDEMIPDDVVLDLKDQVDIQTSWMFLKKKILENDEDPTSIYNSSL